MLSYNNKAGASAMLRQYESPLGSNFTTQVVTLTDSVMRYEDEAIKRAVCRFYNIKDPFMAIEEMSQVIDCHGCRRFIDHRTGTTIIKFDKHESRFIDGRITITVNYHTYDGKD